jgi:ribosomal protein S18 acetylase RimI-like enzyme
MDMRYALKIRPLSPADRDWVARHVAKQWGAEIVVAHCTIYRPAELPGFVVELDGKVAGLVTFHIAGDACEIVTLDSLSEGRGIGTALLEAVKAEAHAAGCRRLWLITTNDNLHALGFYQKRGFRLVAVHPGAVDAAHKLKPEIPLIGNDGIPILDEIELEIVLI